MNCPYKHEFPLLLHPEQILKLKELLKSRPADGGIWTGPKVARWISC